MQKHNDENTPDYVKLRFPDSKESFEWLFQKDPLFREICHDYQDTANALTDWLRSTDFSADPIIEEYRTLLQELETEILRYMQDHTKEI